MDEIKMVFFNVEMIEEIRQALKMIAVRRKMTMNEVAVEFIANGIKENVAKAEKKLSGEI
jgi:hypothetical protein